MVKCNLCKDKIEETFLNKILGTVVKHNNKLNYICKSCQKKYSHRQILDKL
jgi:hypothetical protein